MTTVSLMYDTGHPKLVLCDNLEGEDGKGGGREVQGRGDTSTGKSGAQYILVFWIKCAVSICWLRK